MRYACYLLIVLAYRLGRERRTVDAEALLKEVRAHLLTAQPGRVGDVLAAWSYPDLARREFLQDTIQTLESGVG